MLALSLPTQDRNGNLFTFLVIFSTCLNSADRATRPVRFKRIKSKNRPAGLLAFPLFFDGFILHAFGRPVAFDVLFLVAAGKDVVQFGFDFFQFVIHLAIRQEYAGGGFGVLDFLAVFVESLFGCGLVAGSDKIADFFLSYSPTSRAKKMPKAARSPIGERHSSGPLDD